MDGLTLIGIDPSFSALGWYVAKLTPGPDGDGAVMYHLAHGVEKFKPNGKTQTRKLANRGEKFAQWWQQLIHNYKPNFIAFEGTLASQNNAALITFSSFTFGIPLATRLSGAYPILVTPTDVKKFANVDDGVNKPWAIKRWTRDFNYKESTKVNTVYALLARSKSYELEVYAEMSRRELEAVADAYSVAYAALQLKRQFISKYF